LSDDDETDLLAAIAADPDDAQAREVYADWLDKRADPRGEYVRLEAHYHAIPARLAQLAAMFDAAWLASVARRYDVVLVDAGPNKIGAIKLVRELTGMGLKDAKDSVVGVARSPQLIVADVDRDVALDVVDRFRATGALARAVPHGTPKSSLPTSRVVALPRGVKVVLASVEPAQRIAAIMMLREVCERGMRDAYRLVEQVIAGTPMTLYADTTIERAAEVLKRFASVGVVECTPT
jgi:large subunit ribosomal protein L7/L12